MLRLKGPSTCAHVDVRINELDESALSSLLMPMLPVQLLGTEERGAGQRATRSRWRPPTGLALALLTLFYPWFYLNSVSMTTFIMKRAECGGVCAVAQLWAPS